MKLLKLILFALVYAFVTSTESKTSSHTKMRMQSLQSLLSEYESFNKRAENFQKSNHQ